MDNLDDILNRIYELTIGMRNASAVEKRECKKELSHLLDKHQNLTGKRMPTFLESEVHTRGVGNDDIVEGIAHQMSSDEAGNIANQIANYNTYPILLEEVRNALIYESGISRVLGVPVIVGGETCTIGVVMEAKEGSLYVDLVGNLPSSLLKESADILSRPII